ncbi:HDOD domain-containing protein [Aquimonas sp.]|jgi:HD-like signal output (HDOD) protein/ActR/RegA family two-component response regulator|uniref:HDOD domain-containing protein n=1 Tax=Aquimonas sp. TaxID=1872588 RepID=UPI0037C035C3
MKVLFVDDERRVLVGIERMLFGLNRDWEILLATSGAEALAVLEQGSIDVVVTDMRMPGMDGAELLRQVRQRSPATMRMLLSGHTETQAAMRALDVAQQFLSKPCDPQVLVDTIEGAVALRNLLADPEIGNTVGRMATLPAAPHVFAKLNQALQDPNCDARQIGAILAEDPAMTAKVLHMANSAFFPSAGRAVTDLKAAVQRIGSTMIRNLVLAAEVFSQDASRPDVAELQKQALLTSVLATRLAGGRTDADMIGIAALLANVGRLLPQPEGALAERFGYAEVGAYLLGVWGLPMAIVEAVAHHTHPQRGSPREFGMAGVVHVAVALIAGEQPDHDYLKRMQVADRLDDWQAKADAIKENDNV